jgi:hypothetical protein
MSISAVLALRATWFEPSYRLVLIYLIVPSPWGQLQCWVSYASWQSSWPSEWRLQHQTVPEPPMRSRDLCMYTLKFCFTRNEIRYLRKALFRGVWERCSARRYYSKRLGTYALSDTETRQPGMPRMTVLFWTTRIHFDTRTVRGKKFHAEMKERLTLETAANTTRRL